MVIKFATFLPFCSFLFFSGSFVLLRKSQSESILRPALRDYGGQVRHSAQRHCRKSILPPPRAKARGLPRVILSGASYSSLKGEVWRRRSMKGRWLYRDGKELELMSTAGPHFLKRSLCVPVRSSRSESLSAVYTKIQSASMWQSRDGCHGPMSGWSL